MNRTLTIGTLSSLIALTLSGCAFQGQVERFGVEYNSALATMTNEQTLLNILRAKEGLPAHFTSVNRFNGTLGMRANGSLNGVLRGDGLTSTVNSGDSLNTTTATAGVTTVAGATNSLSDVIAEGVDQFTPQVTGEFNSGTTFEVSVFDSQKFYNGYLSAVPFPVIESFINQGFDPQLIFMLFVSRIDVRYDEDAPEIKKRKGDIAFSIENNPGNFNKMLPFVECFQMSGADFTPNASRIAAMSRFTVDQNNKSVQLDLEKFGIIDGEKFALSSKQGLSATQSDDDKVFLTNVPKKSRIVRFILDNNTNKKCDDNKRFSNTGEIFNSENPPKDKFIQLNKVKTPSDTDLSASKFDLPIPITNDHNNIVGTRNISISLELLFRSPEGLMRYIGAYLRQPDKENGLLSNNPLFRTTPGRVKNALVSARFNGESYSLINPKYSVRYTEVLNIIQQVVNLQKESTDRPVSIPVRAIPQ